MFVGNTCNYSSLLAECLVSRYQGNIDITIAVEKDCCDRDKPGWDDIFLDESIKCITFNPRDVVRPFMVYCNEKFAACVQKADVIHCFGLMAAWYVSKFSSKFVYHSYGDLLSTPFVEKGRYLWTSYRAFHTRRVLKRASRIIISQYQDLDVLDKLNYRGDISEIPILHFNPKKKYAKNINATPKELIFYFPSRHVSIKRLHVAISAVCKYVNENRLMKSRIILTDWGDQTALAKELIQDAGLAEITTWIPVQKKSDLLQRLSRCNTIVFDEFPDKTIPMSLGGISRDAVSCGALLISTFTRDYESALYDSSPPFFIVDPETNNIGDQIKAAVYTNQTGLVAYKKTLLEWYEKNFDQDYILDRYLQIYREMI